MTTGYTPNGTPGTSLVPGGAPMPSRGVFGSSEVIPLIQDAARRMREAGEEWHRLRSESDHRKSEAKRIRANLLIRLRVMGKPETGGYAIKTSVERNEWASADPDVQAAELAADVAQTAQMVAKGLYDEATAQFGVLQSMLAIERDEWKAERSPGG